MHARIVLLVAGALLGTLDANAAVGPGDCLRIVASDWMDIKQFFSGLFVQSATH